MVFLVEDVSLGCTAPSEFSGSNGPPEQKLCYHRSIEKEQEDTMCTSRKMGRNGWRLGEQQPSLPIFRGPERRQAQNFANRLSCAKRCQTDNTNATRTTSEFSRAPYRNYGPTRTETKREAQSKKAQVTYLQASGGVFHGGLVFPQEGTDWGRTVPQGLPPKRP